MSSLTELQKCCPGEKKIDPASSTSQKTSRPALQGSARRLQLCFNLENTSNKCRTDCKEKGMRRKRSRGCCFLLRRNGTLINTTKLCTIAMTHSLASPTMEIMKESLSLWRNMIWRKRLRWWVLLPPEDLLIDIYSIWLSFSLIILKSG